MYKKIISVLFIFAFAFSLVSCNMDDEVGSDNGVVAPVTQIANEFSAQLPDFNFSEDIVDSYEESLRYSFSVECSEKESEKYIKAVKKVGFTEGYPETAPVSGNGYYKASNAEKYMIEIVYKNSILTVHVTRP